MARYGYERLSALDNFFLLAESASTPMHVGSTALFEAEPLSTAQGGIDSNRIKQYIAARLDRMPRYRQRLARIPLERRTVWVDDPHLDLDYHVRHTSLPKPGDETQLKQLSAHLQAQPLDLARPLWETWIVEGVQDGRCALIFKVHHCMIDGVTGADLLSALLSPTAEAGFDAPARWVPRPPPSRAELLRDEIFDRVKGPVALAAHVVRHPLTAASEFGGALGAVAETLAPSLRSASPTPLNQPIGLHRRFDWAAMDLATIRQVKDALGGAINDVVLATVAGAVRTFLRWRGVDVSRITFRVFVPVSLRSALEHGTWGNRVAGWIVDLPVAESDACKRFLQIRDTTLRLKRSNHARGAEVLTELAEWTSASLAGMAIRLAAETTLPFNLVVTNVPGPPAPLYLLGGRLQAVYPMVPLFVNLGLGIALFSNAGKLFWGFNADWDVVPDLGAFVDATSAAFRELCAASSERPAPVRAQRRIHKRMRRDFLVAPSAQLLTPASGNGMRIPAGSGDGSAAGRSSAP